jgi:hypothetical protein
MRSGRERIAAKQAATANGSALPRAGGSPKETMVGEGSRGYAHAVAAWALVETGDREAIDVFLTREDAERALADCLRDEPGWRGLLWIEEVELAGKPPSPN